MQVYSQSGRTSRIGNYLQKNLGNKSNEISYVSKYAFTHSWEEDDDHQIVYYTPALHIAANTYIYTVCTWRIFVKSEKNLEKTDILLGYNQDLPRNCVPRNPQPQPTGTSTSLRNRQMVQLFVYGCLKVMCIISSQCKSHLGRPCSPNDHYLGHTNRTCNACRDYNLHLLVQFGRHTAGRRQQEYKEFGYQSKCLVAIASWLKLRRQIARRQLSRPQKATPSSAL